MKKCRVVIPMSGLGSRFVRAGYAAPKPLIEVHGRPMIEWVLRMFPGVEDPIFICRREHIQTTPMRAILERLKPKGQVVVIEGAKLGPVDAILNAIGSVPADDPVVVSYCDYYMQWDFQAFLAKMSKLGAAGSVPCYTGFHPHLLPARNLYACCRVDSRDRLLEIREKFTFDPDKSKALHSPGVYYFDSGSRLETYARRLVEANDSLGGEFYVSMIYNHMIRDALPVFANAIVSHFCQWGVPEDLHEYLYWTEIAGRMKQ